jgi:hypothetical protein
MKMQPIIDWNAAEQQFVEKSLEALDRLQKKHSSVPLSFFAFYSNYFYGKNSIAVDSYENSLLQAREHYEWVVRNRLITMTHANAASQARYHWSVASKRVVDYSPHAGKFWKPDYGRVNFREWELFFRGEAYDENLGSQGHVIVLFWRVFERLLEMKAFDNVNMSPLFRLGFQFEDDDLGLVVAHILRWPAMS